MNMFINSSASKTGGSTSQAKSSGNMFIGSSVTPQSQPVQDQSLPRTGQSYTQPKSQSPAPQSNIFDSAKSVFNNLQNIASKVINYKSQPNEGLGAPIGRILQKTPDTTIKYKKPTISKVVDFVSNPIAYPLRAADEKIVEFLSGFPGEIARSYGKSLELLSTPEGKKQIKQGAINLPQTINQVKDHIEKKQWQEALNVAMSNPAVSVAIDVSDFIPVAGVAGFATKKSLSASKTLVKKIIKEGIEEVEEKALKELPAKVFQTPEPKVEAPKIETPAPVKSAETTQIITQSTQPSVIPSAVRKQAQENISNLIRRVDTPEQVTKVVDTLIETHKTDPAKLKVIRAQLQKDMVNISGASSGYYKTDFKHLQQAKTDSVLGPFLKNIQTGIDKIDGLLFELPSPRKEVKPTATSLVPTEKGEAKVSKLGLRVEQTAIEKKLTDELTDLPEYRQINMKDQARQAAELINKDPDRAMRIAMGDEAPPAGLKVGSVFKAMENSITTPEMANQLAHSKIVNEFASTAGQEVKAFDVKTSDSPVEAIKQVIDARAKAIEEKTGKTINQATADIVKQIKKSVDESVPDKSMWASFIQEIKC